jgi:hypothetical protein
MVMLEGNVHVMKSLKRYYKSVINRNGFPAELKLGVCNDIDCFSSQVEDIIENLGCNISRAKFLAGLIRDRKDVIQFHFQGQAAERMETMNHHMEKESVVMGIITLITLIYLPATFVSVNPYTETIDRMLTRKQTFFSTDVVKYQNPNGGPPTQGIFSSKAMARWFQVTVPLTLVTLFGCLILYASLSVGRKRGGWRLLLRRILRRSRPGLGDNISLLPLHAQATSPV